eukprot:m.61078 g.61078  ORF g.61078 m.61078 type:complete len:95 (+) comp49419_c0_seq10:137-421(+)
MIRTSRSVCHFCAILSFILDRSETQFDSAPRIIRHTASKSPCDFVKGSPDLDSKYAWLVCLTGFIANAVGVCQSFCSIGLCDLSPGLCGTPRLA